MDSLPDELLVTICEDIASPVTSFTSPMVHDASRDLAALCATNHRLKRIATPLLYHSIDCRMENRDTHLVDFLRTLQEAPDLRRHIKSIRHRPHIGSSYKDKIYQDGSVDQRGGNWIRRMILSTAKELQLPQANTIYHDWMKGDDIPLALAALQTPELEQLGARYPYNTTNSREAPFLLEALVRAALGKPLGATHGFEKLRVLYLEFWDSSEWPIATIAPLVLLPSLQDLSLTRWTSPYYDDLTHYPNNYVFGLPPVWPVISCNLTRLALHRPRASSAVIAGLINTCKTLTSFECTSPITREGGDWFANISAALSKHSDTLEHLGIGLSNTSQTHRMYYSLYNVRPSAALHRLSSIRLPLFTTASHSDYMSMETNIPTSVENLHLDIPKGAEETAEIYFSYFLDACIRGAFPHLKYIRLRFKRNCFLDDFPFPFTKYEPPFKVQGVRLDAMFNSFAKEAELPDPITEHRIKAVFPGHYDYWAKTSFVEDTCFIFAGTFKDVGSVIELEQTYWQGF